MPNYVLYKWAAGWNLPSIDPSSTQAEAYLRLAGVPLAVQECTGARSAPTGVAPALELDGDLYDAPPGATPAEAAAAVVAAAAAAGADLDAALPPAARAEVAAWTALATTALEPASTYAAWCEPASYASHTRPAYGADLPFPLSTLVPAASRRAVARRFAGAHRDKVYDAAVAAHAALAARLATSPGGGAFFFGASPSSLDALLFAHLSFHAAAPVAAPELRESVARHPTLARYVDGLAARLSVAPPPPPPPYDNDDWNQRAEAAAAAARSGRKKPQPRGGGGGAAAARDPRRRGNIIWLACAAALLVGYVAFSGQYIEFALDDLEYEDEEGDE